MLARPDWAKVARLLGLVLILNVLRYLVGGLVESVLIFPGLFNEMANHADHFNTGFTRLDWLTSYLYNFMIWLACV